MIYKTVVTDYAPNRKSNQRKSKGRPEARNLLRDRFQQGDFFLRAGKHSEMSGAERKETDYEISKR